MGEQTDRQTDRAEFKAGGPRRFKVKWSLFYVYLVNEK